MSINNETLGQAAEKVTKLVDKICKKDKKNFTFLYNYFGQCMLIKK